MSGPEALHPRIYVASLSDYNAGRLHGVWIEVTDDIATVWTQVDAMLATSNEPNAEEWAIHDYEGFGEYRVSEYQNLELVVRIAAGIHEHGEAFACFASLLDTGDIDELDRFDDMYCGTYDSLRGYAEELLDGLGVDLDPEAWAPEIIAPYVRVDLDGFARSLEFDYRICDGARHVHIFEP